MGNEHQYVEALRIGPIEKLAKHLAARDPATRSARYCQGNMKPYAVNRENVGSLEGAPKRSIRLGNDDGMGVERSYDPAVQAGERTLAPKSVGEEPGHLRSLTTVCALHFGRFGTFCSRPGSPSPQHPNAAAASVRCQTLLPLSILNQNRR